MAILKRLLGLKRETTAKQKRKDGKRTVTKYDKETQKPITPRKERRKKRKVERKKYKKVKKEYQKERDEEKKKAGFRKSFGKYKLKTKKTDFGQ